jgi:hypothetical protein
MRYRYIVAFFLLLLSLTASAGPCLSICKGGRTFVYRGDARPPEQIFEQGFASRGNNRNLNAYLSGGAQDTAYEGTTRDIGRATSPSLAAASGAPLTTSCAASRGLSVISEARGLSTIAIFTLMQSSSKCHGARSHRVRCVRRSYSPHHLPMSMMRIWARMSSEPS